MDIQAWHEMLFQAHLERQKVDPGFTFSFRKSTMRGRLDLGWWLLGGNDYIAASPYRWQDEGRNNTQVIYFCVTNLDGRGKKKIHLGIIPQDGYAKFFDRVVEEVGKIINAAPKSESRVKRFGLFDEDADFSTTKQELVKFWDDIIPKIDMIAEEEKVMKMLKYGKNTDGEAKTEEEHNEEFEEAKKRRDSFNANKTRENIAELTEDNAMSNEKQLNVIFYGPPGTGKTYNTINRGLEIIQGINPDDFGRPELLERFNALKNEGHIEMITFHQNFAYEDFIEGIKPRLGDDSDEGISYELRDGVFKKIANRANESRERRLEGRGEKIDVDALLDAYATFVENKIDNEGAVVFHVNGKHKSIVRVERDESDKFRYFQISTNRSDAASKLRHTVIKQWYEQFERGEITSPSGIRQLTNPNKQVARAAQYLALFQEMRDFKVRQKESFVQEESRYGNYVLIIDEINRGNIAKIFGELITLIEESKRLGRDEATQVKLPYSQNEFGVPDNLYIIGTMNTADRSLTLLDTALRRRFDFEEMMPDPNECPENIEGVNCQELLRVINERIRAEHDYGREHQIGHSYFMGAKKLIDLARIFQSNILPLLQEYFFEDKEKIHEILKGGGFVDREGEVIKNAAWNDAKSYTAIYKKAGGSVNSEDAGDAEEAEGDAQDEDEGDTDNG